MRMELGKVMIAFGLLVAVVAAVAVIFTATTAQTEKDGTHGWNPAVIVPLFGDQVRPHPVYTEGTGVAVFWLNDGLNEICYMVHVSELDDDVTQVSINWARDGRETGEAVAYLSLVMHTRHGEDDEGIIALGSITERTLTGPMAGASMAKFIGELDAGNLYINVITEGFPSGEVRGNIDANATCSDIMALVQEMLKHNGG